MFFREWLCYLQQASTGKTSGLRSNKRIASVLGSSRGCATRTIFRLGVIRIDALPRKMIRATRRASFLQCPVDRCKILRPLVALRA